MIGDLATWQRLMAPELAEFRAAAESGAGALSVSEIAALRKRHPAEVVSAAVELGDARRRGVVKFGEVIARRLVADRAGVEMASSAAVSRHKAGRFAGVVPRGESVADLCCGIGGDAMGMAAAGLEVVGVDSDEVRAWMCWINTGCKTVCDRVENASARWFHLDPARRVDGGRRVFDLEQLVPGPGVWREVIARASDAAAGCAEKEEGWGGAIKLGPGVGADEVQAAIGAGVPLELEYISEHGRMSQAVAWLGRLAGESPVRATAIRGDVVHSMAGEAGEPAAGELGAFVLEADDAAERAGLLGLLSQTSDARSIAAGLGLLTSDRAGPSAWFESFEVVARMPWNEKRLRTWLREHDAGVVEVKTRAGAVEPDSLQQRLRGTGAATFSVFVLRIGRTMEAFITRRVAKPVSA